MRAQDAFMRSVDGLLRVRSRTLLTMTAVSIGSFSLLLALALGQGGGDYAQRIIAANIDTRALWVMKKLDPESSGNRPSTYEGVLPLAFNQIGVETIDEDDRGTIESVSGIRSVDPIVTINSAYVTRKDEKKYQAIINALHPGMQTVYLAGGADRLKDEEVLLPDGYRQALHFPTPEAAIGSKIAIRIINGKTHEPETRDRIFTVKGVFEQSSSSLSLAPTAMLVTPTTVSKLNDSITQNTEMSEKYVAFSAITAEGADRQVVKKQIENLGYYAQTPDDVYGGLYQFSSVMRFILLSFGVLAVVTAVFGIANTQYMSVTERIQEIGLMKALGMKRQDVARLFRLEAGIIGFFGSCVGAFFGVLLGVIANPLITQTIALDKTVKLFLFSPLAIVGVIIGLTVISVLAGILPARIAAEQDPIEALRKGSL